MNGHGENADWNCLFAILKNEIEYCILENKIKLVIWTTTDLNTHQVGWMPSLLIFWNSWVECATLCSGCLARPIVLEDTLHADEYNLFCYSVAVVRFLAHTTDLFDGRHCTKQMKKLQQYIWSLNLLSIHPIEDHPQCLFQSTELNRAKQTTLLLLNVCIGSSSHKKWNEKWHRIFLKHSCALLKSMKIL